MIYLLPTQDIAGYEFDRAHARCAEEVRFFTKREIEVLNWVARGKSAREIAEILHITKRTVDAHVHSAIRKIGAVNRTNAVAIAIRDRIVEV